MKLTAGSVMTRRSSLPVPHSVVVPTVELRIYFKSELIQVHLPVNSTVAQVRTGYSLQATSFIAQLA